MMLIIVIIIIIIIIIIGVKAGTVMFGRQLPSQYFTCVDSDFPYQVDLMLVIYIYIIFDYDTGSFIKLLKSSLL